MFTFYYSKLLQLLFTVIKCIDRCQCLYQIYTLYISPFASTTVYCKTLLAPDVKR